MGDTIVAPFSSWVGDVIGAAIDPGRRPLRRQRGWLRRDPASAISSGAEWVRIFFSPTRTTTAPVSPRIQNFIDAGPPGDRAPAASRQFDVDDAITRGARAHHLELAGVLPGSTRRTGATSTTARRSLSRDSSRARRWKGPTRPDTMLLVKLMPGWPRQNAEGRRLLACSGGRVASVRTCTRSRWVKIRPYVVTSDDQAASPFRVDPLQRRSRTVKCRSSASSSTRPTTGTSPFWTVRTELHQRAPGSTCVWVTPLPAT